MKPYSVEFLAQAYFLILTISRIYTGIFNSRIKWMFISLVILPNAMQNLENIQQLLDEALKCNKGFVLPFWVNVCSAKQP